MNVEFRAVIHCCWLERLSPQETFEKMRNTYGPTFSFTTYGIQMV